MATLTLTVPQLIDLCKQRGISGYSRKTRDELIQLCTSKLGFEYSSSASALSGVEEPPGGLVLPTRFPPAVFTVRPPPPPAVKAFPPPVVTTFQFPEPCFKTLEDAGCKDRIGTIPYQNTKGEYCCVRAYPVGLTDDAQKLSEIENQIAKLASEYNDLEKESQLSKKIQLVKVGKKLNTAEALPIAEQQIRTKQRNLMAQIEALRLFKSELTLKLELNCPNLSANECVASPYCQYTRGYFGTRFGQTCYGKQLTKYQYADVKDAAKQLLKMADRLQYLERIRSSRALEGEELNEYIFLESLKRFIAAQIPDAQATMTAMDVLTKQLNNEKTRASAIQKIQELESNWKRKFPPLLLLAIVGGAAISYGAVSYFTGFSVLVATAEVFERASGWIGRFYAWLESQAGQRAVKVGTIAAGAAAKYQAGEYAQIPGQFVLPSTSTSTIEAERSGPKPK